MSLLYQISQEKRCKKLVLVLATSTLITTARKKVSRNVKTGETKEMNKNSKNDKNGDKNKNLETNFI